MPAPTGPTLDPQFDPLRSAEASVYRTLALEQHMTVAELVVLRVSNFTLEELLDHEAKVRTWHTRIQRRKAETGVTGRLGGPPDEMRGPTAIHQQFTPAK